MKYYKDICSEIFSLHEKAENYKSRLGKKGVFEQTRQNKRFYFGDQWFGAKTGSNRPLVRHNIIKRIGDYKTAAIGGENIKFVFSPVGISSALQSNEQRILTDEIIGGKRNAFDKISDAEILLCAKAISQYFSVCSKRIHLEDICNQALKNSYISGSGIVYIYWDNDIKTGLFADNKRKVPIMGDIQAEVIDIENVDFADPNNDDVQSQDYIIISSRVPVLELIREAKRNKVPHYQIENIKPDDERLSEEADYSKKATVLTKLYKVYDENGGYSVKAIRVCKGAIIRPEWDIGLKIYPIAKFNWEQNGTAYGESEITNLIPNQIAINRMLTASVWSVMMTGMPIMLVNGDVITEPITNSPGQIISFSGSSEDFERCVKYINPPQFSNNFNELTTSLIENTLSASGATDAALGTVIAQNTSAINAVKESARLPLNFLKKRYLSFLEDIAKIILEFMLNMYGSRPIGVKQQDTIWYFPFEAKRYKDLSFVCEATVENTQKVDIEALTNELNKLENSEKLAISEALKTEDKEFTEAKL